MYYSRMLIPTIRETPQEAEAVSHKLMLKAGLIRRLASGVYIFLPLGYKALRNIERIIREEMDKKGALELLMSALIPKELLEQSGRWEVFGPEMFRLKDRSERELCLGPAHEESFTITARNEIRSVKNLPLTLYQIQTKFRDELRPGHGIIRSREFLMKDAYSFDKDESGLDKSYNDMHDAYCNIFARCGLDVVIAYGAGSEEFMVLSDIGEDKVVTCTVCDYAANQEIAEAVSHNTASSDTLLNMELLHTPNIKTIDDLCSFMGCSSVNFAKTLILVADGEPVMAVIRGDKELSLKKLAGLLKCDKLSLAENHLVEKLTGAAVGFASPVGMKCKVVLDNQLRNMTNFVTGANKTDYHYINVNLKDFTSYSFHDISKETKTVYELVAEGFPAADLPEILHKDAIEESLKRYIDNRKKLFSDFFSKNPECTEKSFKICGYDPMNMVKLDNLVWCKYFVMLKEKAKEDPLLIYNQVVLKVDETDTTSVSAYYTV
jgi:prolyl-tRNA synthetase